MKTIIRKLIAFVLSVLMLTGVVMPVAAKEDTTSFADVKSSAWYYNAVTYAVENGLMVGTSVGKFSPQVKFTRAMTVQVLSKLSGDDLTSYTDTDFPDVPDGAWFETAVAWAVDKNIVVGIDGKFKPNDSVTREQLARMIHQFAEKYDITNMFPTVESADNFADAKRIGAWAKADVEWAVHNGVISGVGGNKLDPRGTATRAQAAQIFYYVHYMKAEGILPPDTKDFDAITIPESDALQIFCWGDSMTAGGYPEELRDYAYKQGYTSSELKVYNYGAGGDTAEHCAMKQGAMPMYVAPFTLPADNTTPVRVKFYDENLQLVESLADLGTKGLSPVIIAGQAGRLSYNCDEETGEEFYYFTRQGKGPFEEIKVNRLTRVVTKGMTMPDKDDFHVIFTGPSNSYEADEAYKLIATQQRMIDYIGTDNYIIISLTCLEYFPGVAQFNADLAEYYGEHFLDFRSYVLNHGMDDAIAQGMLEAATDDDLADIARGEIPPSMRADDGKDPEHGNFVYNRLLGQQVYKRMIELGYIEDK